MNSSTSTEPFRFKQFIIEQDRCGMKVGTDGVLLGAWADVSDADMILDIGTGSGLISIMLAQRTGGAKIYGVEIDQDAHEQARANMQRSPWADRLEAIHMPVQDFAASSSRRYDLIVSNPPFFTGGNLSYNQDRNSVRHTIKLPHQDLLFAVRRLLSDRGRFALILPHLEGLRFRELSATYQLYCTRMTEVYPKAGKSVERLLMQFEKEERSLHIEQLFLYQEHEQSRTSDYQSLTEAFYLT